MDGWGGLAGECNKRGVAALPLSALPKTVFQPKDYTMTTHHVVARNFSTHSENRMHSDEMASRYGFQGALVPGVAIYGHLIKPLVDHFGAAWLNDSCVEVKLIKPTSDSHPCTGNH